MTNRSNFSDISLSIAHETKQRSTVTNLLSVLHERQNNTLSAIIKTKRKNKTSPNDGQISLKFVLNSIIKEKVNIHIALYRTQEILLLLKPNLTNFDCIVSPENNKNDSKVKQPLKLNLPKAMSSLGDMEAVNF